MKRTYVKREGTLNSLEVYFDSLKNFKPLGKDEEFKLLELAQKGDINARNIIMKSHLQFVIKIAKRFRKSGLDLEDLISEGNFGLIKAIEKFDPKRNVRFISCAVWWIRLSIQTALNETKHYNEYHIRDNVMSEDMELDIDKCDDSEKLLAETEESVLFDEEDAETTNNSTFEEIKSIAKEMFDEKEYYVFNSYTGLDGSQMKPLSEISKDIGLSRERTRQIKEKCLKVIRSEILKREITYVSI